MSSYEFRQVDVFSSEPLRGNPVAVVHGADGLSDEQMQAFASWTHLSETTFLLEPTDPAADYRVRIFTPSSELPFAGHPTLGTAHAWLEAGGVPANDGEIVQECGVGLVRLRQDARLAFAAPELIRGGDVEPDVVAQVAAGLGISREEIVDAQWCDNGPGWVAVLLADADAVLALRPDPMALGDLAVGAVGRTKIGAVGPTGAVDPAEPAIEVRAFVGGLGVDEDPVTGSLNAAVGQWLAGTRLPEAYVASQGTALGRRGRVHIERSAGQVWVGGDTLTTITGAVAL